MLLFVIKHDLVNGFVFAFFAHVGLLRVMVVLTPS
jgi:hypothetical protein